MMLKLDGRRLKPPLESGKISELLRLLSIPTEEVLVKVNGKLAPEDATVGPRDKVEVIKVVFGG